MAAGACLESESVTFARSASNPPGLRVEGLAVESLH